ncbi:MAG: mechanosensitive ion channel family protein [Bacteroidia bacterium]
MKKTHLLLFFFYCISLGFVWAQAKKTEPTEEIHLGTPYHAIKNHLDHLQPRNYHPAMAAKSLVNEGHNKEEMEKLAIQLLQIYNGEGFYVKWRKVPMDSNFVDTTQQPSKARYIIYDKYPEIYLEKKGKKWLYSARSVQAIPEIHQKVYPFGTAKLLEKMPKGGQSKWLGMYVWQYIALAGLLLFAFLLFKLLDVLLAFLIRKISNLQTRWLSFDFIRPVARPLSLLIVVTILKITLPVLQLPILSGKILMMCLRVSAPIFGVITVYYLVDLLSESARRFAQSTDTTLDNQLIPLIRKVLKMIVIVMGIIFTLQTLDVNVTALLAGVSIGGLAFALAAQDTVKNFLGSVTILVDEPFQIGDYIEADSKSGTVEEVGLRSTRIRTGDGSLISIPNSKLADSSVLNGGARRFRKFQPKLLIDAQTPLPQIRSFIAELQIFIDKHELTNEENNQVHLHNLTGKNLEISVIALFDSTKEKESQVRQNILSGILELAEKHGVKFVGTT